MKDAPKITVAIESAIAGGSISLLSDRDEIDSWIGEDSVSRAEDLLPNISALMHRHSIARQMINAIIVSVGPGSYTGIRIGIATALGLKNSLNIPCVGVSALEAIAKTTELKAGRLIAAVPMGRNALCFQIFDVNEQGIFPFSEPLVEKPLPREVVEGCEEIMVHASIFQTATPESFESKVRNAGTNLALLIGGAGISSERQRALEPIFARPAA